MEQTLLTQVQRALTPDLLKPAFRAVWSPENPLYGHCYVAAEALFHLLGGKASGYVPHAARDGHGIVHWWLETADGRILDPTAAQYLSIGEQPPYAHGRGKGFLTRAPSKRAQRVMERVK